MSAAITVALKAAKARQRPTAFSFPTPTPTQRHICDWIAPVGRPHCCGADTIQMNRMELFGFTGFFSTLWNFDMTELKARRRACRRERHSRRRLESAPRQLIKFGGRRGSARYRAAVT